MFTLPTRNLSRTRIALCASALVIVLALVPTYAALTGDTFRITSPASGSTVGNASVTLSWTAVGGATKYKLQLSSTDDPNFRGADYTRNTSGLSYTLTNVYKMTYIARVTAFDASGSRIGRTPTITFVVGTGSTSATTTTQPPTSTTAPSTTSASTTTKPATTTTLVPTTTTPPVGGINWRKAFKASPAWWQANLHFNWQEQNVTSPTGNMNLIDVDLLSVIPSARTVSIPGVGSYTVDVDTTAGSKVIANAHAAGVGVICYIDTGAVETYWPDYKLLSPYKGAYTGWSGEYWMNTNNQAQWGPIMLARIQLAADIGCDGVEGDQNDGAQNGSGATLESEILWYKTVAEKIHSTGMSWALMKNGYFEAEGSGPSGKPLAAALAPYYDAILIEQSYELRNDGANYREVTSAFANAGKPVIAVDYTAANGHTYFNNTSLFTICSWHRAQGFAGYIFHDDPDNSYRYECGTNG